MRRAVWKSALRKRPGSGGCAPAEMIDAAVAAWRVEYEARRSVERPKEAEWKRRERARKRQAGQAPNGAMSGDDGRVSRQDTPDEIALGR